MKYHASLLCLLAIAKSVCADDFGHSPFPNVMVPAGPMAPKSNPSTFYPFPPSKRLPQSSGLDKRQTTCPTTNSYMCPNGKCCPIGYDCETDGIEDYCCPSGEICAGEIACAVGTTDCGPILGVDGCCPTATHVCDRDSSGVAGCRRLGSGTGGGGGSSNGCSDSTYFPCTDGSGCCKIGTTCISGSDLCQKPCAVGFTECSFGGCCDPGYACDPIEQNCKRSVSGGGGGGGATLTSARSSSSSSSTSTSTSSRTRRTSSISTASFDLPTFDDISTTPTPFPTGASSQSSDDSASAETTPGIGSSPNSGDSLRSPTLFGIVVAGLYLLQL